MKVVRYALVLGVVFAMGAFLATIVGADEFKHGIKVEVDGKSYYFVGPADAPGGAKDVPGHDWVQLGPNELVGYHYNTGPAGAAKWWSSDADDGALLFVVHAIIDAWSLPKAAAYLSKGYTHYHELEGVMDGKIHPTKIVWLRHVAVGSFNFDGGPMPQMGHQVTPGVDYEFMPNWQKPYTAEAH